MTLMVNCPRCGRKTEYSEKNPWRPFCCERCKVIDLGAWADEQYVIAGKPVEGDDDLDISSEDLAKGKYHDKTKIKQKT